MHGCENVVRCWEVSPHADMRLVCYYFICGWTVLGTAERVGLAQPPFDSVFLFLKKNELWQVLHLKRTGFVWS